MVHAYFGILLSDKNELLIYTTMWMNLKCILLSETSQTKNVTKFRILFIWHYGEKKQKQKNQSARVWAGRKAE